MGGNFIRDYFTNFEKILKSSLEDKNNKINSIFNLRYLIISRVKKGSKENIDKNILKTKVK